MGHNGCDGSQAPGPWAIGSGYRFSTSQCRVGVNRWEESATVALGIRKMGGVYPTSPARVPEVKKYTFTPEGGGGGLSEFWLTAG